MEGGVIGRELDTMGTLMNSIKTQAQELLRKQFLYKVYFKTGLGF